MSKKKNRVPLKALVMMAMLSAISIVLGKFLAINVGEVLRFSFENLPIIFAGIAFGPLGGALVATVADLVGCVLVGFTINPLVTLGAFSIGFFSGLFYIIFNRFLCLKKGPSVALTLALSHLFGSVVIKTFGLAAFYDMPFIILMLWRLLNYTVIGAVEFFLLCFLLKNKRIDREIKSFAEWKSRLGKKGGRSNEL